MNWKDEIAGKYHVSWVTEFRIKQNAKYKIKFILW